MFDRNRTLASVQRPDGFDKVVQRFSRLPWIYRKGHHPLTCSLGYRELPLAKTSPLKSGRQMQWRVMRPRLDAALIQSVERTRLMIRIDGHSLSQAASVCAERSGKKSSMGRRLSRSTMIIP